MGCFGKLLQTSREHSQLQRCMRASVVALARLQCVEVDHMIDAFRAADRNNDGQVSHEELSVALGGADCQALFDAIDCDRSGSIIFSEWVTAAATQSLLERGAACRAFAALDIDGDGRISPEELQAALPGVFDVESLSQQMAAFDRDGDSFIDFDEFC